MDNITVQEYERALEDKNMVWVHRAQIINSFRRKLRKMPMRERNRLLRGDEDHEDV